MQNKTISTYFMIISYLQLAVGGLPEEIILRRKFQTFLLNKVWPVGFWILWLPIFTMGSVKLMEFTGKRAWNDVLDLLHIYLLGSTTHYFSFCVQQRAKNFKVCMDIVKEQFFACDQLSWKDFKMWIYLATLVSVSCTLFLLVSVYFGEVPVPLWIPFLDNEKPLPSSVFAFVWAYVVFHGVFIIWIYGFLTPFVVVMTTITLHELDFLIAMGEQFLHYDSDRVGSAKSTMSIDPVSDFEEDSKRFVRGFVKRHLVIISVINEVKKIHDYFFLTQVLFTITHSCFLVFHIYYTDNLTKAVVKSSPFLVVSYYLLFIYCWNGQRLSDKCEDLHLALCRGRWYSSPKSFKTSLLIMMQFCQRPVRLTGGGVFIASFKTFLKGVEQSISYVLILRQLSSGE